MTAPYSCLSDPRLTTTEHAPQGFLAVFGTSLPAFVGLRLNGWIANGV